jgi:hypothetical protein
MITAVSMSGIGESRPFSPVLNISLDLSGTFAVHLLQKIRH